jgi:hypothetical protein
VDAIKAFDVTHPLPKSKRTSNGIRVVLDAKQLPSGAWRVAMGERAGADSFIRQRDYVVRDGKVRIALPPAPKRTTAAEIVNGVADGVRHEKVMVANWLLSVVDDLEPATVESTRMFRAVVNGLDKKGLLPEVRAALANAGSFPSADTVLPGFTPAGLNRSLSSRMEAAIKRLGTGAQLSAWNR